MRFYLSVFPEGRIEELVRYGAAQPGPEGTIALAALTIGGQTIRRTDSFVKHAFTFTPASSLFVDCTSEAEIDRIWTALLEAGECSCRSALTPSAADSAGSTTASASPGS